MHLHRKPLNDLLSPPPTSPSAKSALDLDEESSQSSSASLGDYRALHLRCLSKATSAPLPLTSFTRHEDHSESTATSSVSFDDYDDDNESMTSFADEIDDDAMLLDADGATCASAISRRTATKHVWFADVSQVREYAVTVGVFWEDKDETESSAETTADNIVCPLQLDWCHTPAVQIPLRRENLQQRRLPAKLDVTARRQRIAVVQGCELADVERIEQEQRRQKFA